MNLDVVSEDARLVQLGLQGDRDAFGRLVARYQSPVCALAYSACGNISQSEDLAQETFLIAWRKLSNLKEPEKFKFWIFGIARNLIHNSARKQTRNPLASATPLDEGITAPAAASNPAGHAINKEEEEILWRSLEQIPETYREPLVLFYRQHQSIEEVASTLELSEEAARQRLSRGRKLLQEQVVAFVEGALARTNPGRAFTLAVLAALPVTLTSSAKAATLAAAAAKGGAAATGVTFVSVLGLLLGPLIGLLGSYMGMRAGLKQTRTPRERALMTRYGRVIIIGVVALFVICPIYTYWSEPHLKDHPFLVTMTGLGILLSWIVFIFAATLRFAQVFRRLRLEEQQLHPELFAGQKEPAWMTCKVCEYRSRATLFGLPLVHYRMGKDPGQKLRPAVGWIAIGEVAYGVLFATGGVAVGGISVGGVSVGILSCGGISAGLLTSGGLALGGIVVGGAAIGGIALGGLAIGIIASGGFAVALHAAYGGMAAARDIAVGGLASAAHANDAVARAYFRRHHWLDTTSLSGTTFQLICILLPLMLMGLLWSWGRKLAKRATANKTN